MEEKMKQAINLFTSVLILLILMLVSPQGSFAQTNVSGHITSNTTWTTAGHPYVVTGDLYVDSGVILTIEPGVVIKFDYHSLYHRRLIVDGTLIAEGTPADSIVFTSIRDDEYGGDTNGDGSASNPSTGNWSGIEIRTGSGSSSRLSYCVFRYGGYRYSPTLYGVVRSEGSSPEIQNNLFYNNTKGLVCKSGATPVVHNNRFVNNSDVAISISLTANPDFSGNVLEGNGFSGLGIEAETYTGTYTLSQFELGGVSNVPYAIGGTLTLGSGGSLLIESGLVVRSVGDIVVNNGAELTIEPGVVIKFDYHSLYHRRLIVDGTLIAEGTPADSIVFTSIRDDEYGGDTNGDGSASNPSTGNWSGIEIRTGSGSSSRLSYCVFRYGGYRYSPTLYGVVRSEGSSPEIQNNLFYNNTKGLVCKSGATPVVHNNRFVNNSDVAISISLTANPDFSGNVLEGNGFSGLGIEAETYTGTYTLSQFELGGVSNVPYAIGGTLTLGSGGSLLIESGLVVRSVGDIVVNNGAELTIEPGVVIKFDYHSAYQKRLIVDGTLIAEGTPADSIVFTSVYDDEYGSYVNSGVNLIAEGMAKESDKVTLAENVEFNKMDNKNEISSSSPSPGNWSGIEIRSGSGSSRLSYCVFRYGGYRHWNPELYGVVRSEGSSPEIENCLFNYNTKALYCLESSTAGIENCYIAENNYGVTCEGGTPIIHNNTIMNNHQYDFENLGSNEVNAQSNWWGFETFLEMSTGGYPKNMANIYDVHDDPSKGLVDYSNWTLPARGIFSVTPDTASNVATDFEMIIRGYPFRENVVVKLKRSGFDDLIPTLKTVIDSTQIQAIFDLNREMSGPWDVVVEMANEDTLILEDGFTLIERLIIPFNEWVEFEVADGSIYISDVDVPDIQDLYLFVRKAPKSTSTWNSTWNGSVKLYSGGELVASESGHRDFDINIQNPALGYHTIHIQSVDPGQGQIKLCSAIDTLQLGKWQTGEIIRSYGYDWKRLEVHPDQDALYLQTESLGHFAIAVFFGSLENPEQNWYFPGFNINGHFDGTIPNPPAGTYYIRFLDCVVIASTASQVREYLIFADTSPIEKSPPIELTITELSTYVGGQGSVTVIVSGTGFSESDTVKLVQDGFDDIFAYTVRGDSSKREIRATFDFNNSEPGEYQFKICNDLGQQVTAPKLFSIESSGYYEIWVELIGRNLIRIGREQTFMIRFGNSGNVNANGVPIWISGIPKNVTISPKFDITVPLWLEGQEDLPIILMDDDECYLPLFIPQIRPNEENIIEISLKASIDASSFKLKVWANSPILPSDPYSIFINNLKKNDKSIFKCGQSNGIDEDCVKALIKKLLDYTPIDKWNLDNCIDEIVDRYIENAYDIWDRKNEMPKSEIITTLGMVNPITMVLYDFARPLSEQDMQKNIEKAGNISLNCIKEQLDALINIYNWEDAVRDFSETLGKYLDWYDNIENVYNELNDWLEIYNKCREKEDEDEKDVGPVSSIDPEDKFGPTGYDVPETPLEQRKRFVVGSQPLSYRIEYWNREDATAPAQEVFLKDTLDEKFDISTFEFTQAGLLKWKQNLWGGQYFNTMVDMRPEMDLLVDIEGTFDPDYRVINWSFRSLDPETRELPEDPMAGFLHPIDSTGYQLGWVHYEVQPKPGFTTCTTITNRAWSNFDGVGGWFPAPKEAPWTNTIDAEPPVSEITNILTVANPARFELQWTGEDDFDGSGVKDYSIYVSGNGKPYQQWLRDTTSTSALFTIDDCQNYTFYSIARDNVGQKETAPAEPDTTLPPMLVYDFPSQGWYLGSLPMQVDNDELHNLIPSALGAFGWDVPTQSYQAVTNLATESGYWFSLTQGDTTVIPGTPLESYTTHCLVGWNLIGGIKDSVDFSNPNDNPDGAVIACFGWNSQTNQYYPSNWLAPDKGYWIAVMQECDLTVGEDIPPGKLAKAKGSVAEFYEKFSTQPPAPPTDLLGNDHGKIPTTYALYQNYPNPFNPRTVIKYQLPEHGKVTLKIYNILGQEVRTLIDNQKNAGYHKIIWDGCNSFGSLVSTGLYFYRIEAGEFHSIKKMLILK